MPTPSEAQYWNDLYLAKDTGWDKGVCSPPLERLLKEGLLPRGAAVAFVGAGRGHDAIRAAELGFKVSAFDFAPEACAAMRASADARHVTLEVLQEDVFELATRHPQQFDAIVEHTCFCAIEIHRRAEYVRAVHGALKPGGVLLGVFYAHTKPDGPPYAVTEAQVREFFQRDFALERLVTAPDSFQARAGVELEFVFKKR